MKTSFYDRSKLSDRLKEWFSGVCASFMGFWMYAVDDFKVIVLDKPSRFDNPDIGASKITILPLDTNSKPLQQGNLSGEGRDDL